MPWGVYTVNPLPGGSIAGNGLLSPVLLDPASEVHSFGPAMLSLDADQQHINVPPGITLVAVGVQAVFVAGSPDPSAGELAAEVSFTGEDPESTFSATNPSPGFIVDINEGNWPASWATVVAFPAGGQVLWRVSNSSAHDPIGFSAGSSLNLVWSDNSWDLGHIPWPQPVPLGG